jgi:hypothetical protein
MSMSLSISRKGYRCGNRRKMSVIDADVAPLSFSCVGKRKRNPGPIPGKEFPTRAAFRQ